LGICITGGYRPLLNYYQVLSALFSVLRRLEIALATDSNKIQCPIAGPSGSFWCDDESDTFPLRPGSSLTYPQYSTNCRIYGEAPNRMPRASFFHSSSSPFRSVAVSPCAPQSSTEEDLKSSNLLIHLSSETSGFWS